MQQPSTEKDQCIPPRSLINLEAARQRFGAEKVDLLIELMYTGDKRADAVLAELEALGPGAGRQLSDALSQGLDSLEEPAPG